MPLQSDVALLLADYKELVLRYEALSRAIASRPAPAPQQPAPSAGPPADSMSYAAPAVLQQSHPQTIPVTAAASASDRAGGAEQQSMAGSQFIQRAEEAAEPDLLGGALAPSDPQDSSSAAAQHTAAAAFDPFGPVADTAHGNATDRSVAGPAGPPPADPFLALERAASAIGSPSSGVQTAQDADSELAAFRAELPAAEPDDAQQLAATPAASASQLESAAAGDVADLPGSAGVDASSTPVTAIASSVPEPAAADSAQPDAAQPRSAVAPSEEIVPGNAPSGTDTAAWEASWGDGSGDASAGTEATTAGEPVEHPAEAVHTAPLVVADSTDHAELSPSADATPDPAQDASANADAPAAADGHDSSAAATQKPLTEDDAAQPAAGAGDQAKPDPSVPNGLHAVEARAMESVSAPHDQPPDTGLFAGLDVEARSVDKAAGEEGNGVQDESATEQSDDRAQADGF